jgi:hypothetical protein
VGANRWGREKHAICCVKRLSLDLEDRGNTDIDVGYQMAYGIQTMATDGKDIFLGCYGGSARVSPDLKRIEQVSFLCCEGFGMLPKSIAKSDAKIFFVVRALGGNMRGWRKDPVNNPPRIRLDFFEYKDGKFVDLSKAHSGKK